MPFTLVAFSKSTANTTLLPISVVPDDHVTYSGNDLTVPELNRVIMALAIGQGLTRAQLESPSLRRIFQPDIFPLHPYADLPNAQAVNEGGSSTYTVPAGLGFMDIHDTPFILEPTEILNAKVQNGSTAYQATVFLWLADDIPKPVKGNIFTIKATASITGSAYAWKSGPLSFEQSLPAGRYAVVGMAYKGAGALAGRLIFTGYPWRPGCLGVKTSEANRPIIFRYGNLGIWGEFEHNQPPKLEVMVTGSESSQEVWLDLIQIRAGPGR